MARRRRRSRGGTIGGTSGRAVLAALLLTVVVLAGLQATGAFSVLDVGRSFFVDTADDDAAFLGIQLYEPNGDDGQQVDLMTLTNNADGDLDSISVTLASGSQNAPIGGISTPNSLASGESATVTADLTCDQPVTQVPVLFDIDVSGPDQSVRATRQISVSCTPTDQLPPITSVVWSGGSIDSINLDTGGTEDITVDLWYAGPGDPQPGTDSFDVACGVQTETNTTLGPPDFTGRVQNHVAVYVHEADESWHHPGFDPSTGELESWNSDASGVRWGEGSIEGSFDETCAPDAEKPPAGDVYNVRQEHWLDDREFIFEIVHGNVWSVEWDFGDGDTSTQHYVTHAYAETGTYDLTVTVVIDGEEFVYTEAVEVSDDEPSQDGPPPEDVYDIRQESWLDDREFIFEIVHGNVWSAEWDFGDGTSASNHYVTHTYDADGTYDVTLVAVIDGEEYLYTETIEVAS